MENESGAVVENKPQEIIPPVETKDLEKLPSIENENINYTKIPDEKIVDALKNEINNINSADNIGEILKQEPTTTVENAKVKKVGIISVLWRYLKSMFR